MGEFADRLMPERFEVLGIDLKPFSIGHALRMQKEGCAFIEDGATVSAADLLLGVCICSRTYKEFDDFLNSPASKDWVRKWSRKWMAALKSKDVRKEFNFLSEIKKFKSYMKDGTNEPSFVKEKEHEKPITIGYVYCNPYENLRHLMISEFNCTEEAAMDIPVARALANFYKFLEGKGELTINGW